MSHKPKHTILLIEKNASLRRLMALGLQYRGMHVIEASSPAHLPTIVEQQPDLLLLDIDGGVSSDKSLLTTVQAHPYLATLPTVVLAWECSLPSETQQYTRQPQLTCLVKPFDARTLHATIEQLLTVSTQQAVAATSATLNAQELLLTAHASLPAPSIWPLITAAGLLLAFMGLLGSIAITVLGLLIFMVALLWWTLGRQPEHTTVPNTNMS